MNSYVRNKLMQKRLAYLVFFMLYFNAWYVTAIADVSDIYHHVKLIGKGYRRIP
jgi:hypothetical protein